MSRPLVALKSVKSKKNDETGVDDKERRGKQRNEGEDGQIWVVEDVEAN